MPATNHAETGLRRLKAGKAVNIYSPGSGDGRDEQRHVGTVIVVGLDGGIGNQLFQYAAARALALRLGVAVGLDTRWYAGRTDRYYALDRFAISPAAVDPGTLPFRDGKRLGRLLSGFGGRLSVYRETGLAFDPAVLGLPDGTYLRGVFQSELYFADQEPALRRDLAIVDPPDADNRAVLAEIGASHAVSLHVRRGDYVSNPKIASVHGTVSEDYYRRAAALIAERSGADPRLFVFSDDPAWAQANLDLGFPMRVVDHNGADRASEDLRLMAACRHHVLANSSFSWWGAWLNPSADKIVVAPRPWFRDSALDDSTIVPERWIRLEA